MQILHIYIAPAHNFFGHHGGSPEAHPTEELAKVQCIAGHGIRGDRFYDYRESYKGQITFFASEVFADLCQALDVQDQPPSIVRRNVITHGVDLNSLIGAKFELQGIRFEGVEECRPCAWMEQAVGHGAEQFLKGRGGLRARILTDGELQVGSARLV